MIKKFKNTLTNFILYISIISVIVLITFYILEKSVRNLRLAQFTAIGQNWDQLQLSEGQIREIFKKNDDNFDKDNIDGIYTGYDYYLNYATKGSDNQIYYRQHQNNLNNCIKTRKIYLFGGSLVAGDGIPKNKDLLSSQLSSHSSLIIHLSSNLSLHTLPFISQ